MDRGSACSTGSRAGHPPDRPQLPRWLAGGQAEADLERDQLFEMIAVHLVGAAAEGGLVFVIEDAHWAGASSLLLLRYLVDDLATARLHAVVTCRVEAEAGGDLPRLAGSRAILLSGLSDSDVNRYLELRLGADFAAAHHSELHRRTDGNPLYLAETIRLVEAGGRLVSVPSEAREVINRRLAALAVDTRRILELAAYRQL